MNFVVPADHGVKLKESEQKHKYVYFVREIKETIEPENDGDTNFISALGTITRWCPRGVMVKALGGGFVVREFEHQSRYCAHFRTNTLGKSMNP